MALEGDALDEAVFGDIDDDLVAAALGAHRREQARRITFLDGLVHARRIGAAEVVTDRLRIHTLAPPHDHGLGVSRLGKDRGDGDQSGRHDEPFHGSPKRLHMRPGPRQKNLYRRWLTIQPDTLETHAGLRVASFGKASTEFTRFCKSTLYPLNRTFSGKFAEFNLLLSSRCR